VKDLIGQVVHVAVICDCVCRQAVLIGKVHVLWGITQSVEGGSCDVVCM